LVQLKKTFREGLQMIYFVNLPATVALIVLAQPIISVLFEHGHFSADSTRLTAQALQCFAIGLPFVSITRITSSAFYSLQDSKTPVRAANWAVLVNIAAGALLLKPLGHRGLALGVAIGSFFNFVFHLYDFRKKVGPLGLRSSISSILKMSIAALLMGLALYLTVPFLKNHFGHSSLQRLLILMILIFEGCFLYFIFATLFKIKELEPFLQMFRRKILKRG
ncbi:MAG: polysaccharide biosynthesis C-terminal domain-containing protein, partial [Deltaproteobacteria bacterium]|nr:polysaccharide biosynthesis C-terminal domain-containing protein [Deltaproteobacteria bacterium]